MIARIWISTRTRDRRRDEVAHHAAIEVDERVRGRKQVREMQQTQQHARVLGVESEESGERERERGDGAPRG
jgi:hypothetical protein